MTRMSEVPRVRVVVLNWNSAWFTRRCLRSLRRTDYPAMELVLVDNGSIDGSLEVLGDELDGVTVVRTGANLGFAEGCNRAMRDFDAFDHVALVNNDTVVDPGWLRPLVDALESDAAVGAASARLVLEPAYLALDVRVGRGGVARLERATVGEVDVTAGVRAEGSGATFLHDPAWPLRTTLQLDGPARIWLPVGEGPREVELAFGGAEVDVDGPGGMQLVSAGGRVRVESAGPTAELLNGVGTCLTPIGEGYDRLLGEVDSGGGPVVEVDGFCGGGALLRGRMLDEVGWFDPSFFAYYEDTDLSWRARRRGWRMVAVPDSVIRHAHGGSGGFGGPGFFFLDRRNWLLTVERNAEPDVLHAARHEARRLRRVAVRANVLSPLKHGRRPRTELVGSWARVSLAVGASRRRVRGERDARVGSRPTTRVRSRWQPASRPPAPRHRIGGPRIVYLDVSDTLRSGWRAGIQRVVRGLLLGIPGGDQRLELVPVVHVDAWGRFRRATSAEVASLLAPSPASGPAPPPPEPGALRRAAVAALEGIRLRDAAAAAREALRRRALPDDEKALLLDRLEPGSVFLDADAVWNHGSAPRETLLPQLVDSGVHVVPFVHDLLPLEHPEWFVPELVREFRSTVEAQLSNASWVMANSRATAASVRGFADQLGRPDLDVQPIPLGVDPPLSHEDPPLPSELEGRPYLLVVGTVEPRKNQGLALDVLERLHAEGVDVALVVVGRPGWRTEDLTERLRTHPLAGTHLHWFDAADDHLLDALYHGAAVALVPSLTEGFGLPVLEALARDTPVIASTGGALPEVGRGVADHQDPDDLEGWVAATRRLLTDPLAAAAARAAAGAFEPPDWYGTAAAVGDAVVARHATP